MKIKKEKDVFDFWKEFDFGSAILQNILRNSGEYFRILMGHFGEYSIRPEKQYILKNFGDFSGEYIGFLWKIWGNILQDRKSSRFWGILRIFIENYWGCFWRISTIILENILFRLFCKIGEPKSKNLNENLKVLV